MLSWILFLHIDIIVEAPNGGDYNPSRSLKWHRLGPMQVAPAAKMKLT